MSDRVSIKAPAKINLYLHVTGKRNDGYHFLDSLVVFAKDAFDLVTIEKSELDIFEIGGPFAPLLHETDRKDNLVLKALQMYRADTGIKTPVRLTLEKNLPVGGGIGGGSADAAVAIKGLETLFNAPLKDRSLLAKLGADVPVCYNGKNCIMRGIGDVLFDAPALPAFYMLLVWPQKHTATKDVFTRLSLSEMKEEIFIPPAFDNVNDFIKFLQANDNDLAEPAQAISPEITQALTFLHKDQVCLLARMSGSGSTVFGLFENAQACENAKSAVRAQRPDWWAQTTSILF
ncbi:MAG: 4-(cytidine 5'-diphospho)-2-C-methyl-D-erythritol kinase [Micavibrio aeruginosavorus]|uniref:4-diphosphocytidyl-2-C-methyl-D-erythritol kinase n=1 Tax=Micavibrio aeruginosavorus TaxID=349221 RepID=A0A2W5MZP8_9BACT|nr:MAG: 4-(cytidine 5'-diphospho)-2-C-methyl-D-erythritol kinase [Micavibrio aeruginosavorus]